MQTGCEVATAAFLDCSGQWLQLHSTSLVVVNSITLVLVLFYVYFASLVVLAGA